MEEKELWHDCSSKSCSANFNGVCRQPFMRCQKNIEIAFIALQEKQKQKSKDGSCSSFEENCSYFEERNE